uniref:UDP-glucose epimerase n=1 Tax=Mycena chlorophos TaxID=658473 RepID=A0ABQ0M9C9_MYCCL|nr:UDP-glucose epimerase [Mycena chlorophos]
MSVSTLRPYLTRLLESLPVSPSPDQLQALVRDVLSHVPTNSVRENYRSQWENVLKEKVLHLAREEESVGDDEDAPYYQKMRDLLDVVLTFTELDACDQTFPFTVLQDLLEVQTIDSCSHIFSWIELRANRLTEGLVPQKGKALVLLRTLNDLLRRLSKTGKTTIFCGRILTLLSGVFPLGERSGVNLRGEYGPTWDVVRISTEQDVIMEDVKKESEMEIDEPKKSPPTTPIDKKEDFYNTFWALQLPFSKPPLFAQPGTFDEFQAGVSKVMPVIKEATAKERAMMGSRAGGSVSNKRKREIEPEERNASNKNQVFFAKFLTSPELLDLEIADTNFRRQFLFQLAILLTHLQTFTKTAKGGWATARNRSLQMDFTLEPPQSEWVQETLSKVMDELKQTTPNGRAFAETVTTILEREKNWVKWKNELCTAFDREPWTTELDAKLLEESKQRIAWLGLRAARESHLQHFGKIGTGDIEMLLKEIEAEKRAGAAGTGQAADEEIPGRTVGEEKPVDSDVKMEDR